MQKNNGRFVKGNFKDRTGEKYGRLTFLSIDHVHVSKGGERRPYWLMICECGNHRIGSATDVVNGHTQSCGCLHKEATSKAKKKHGESDTRLYYTWENMKKRCLKKNSERHQNYGGRGITIYPEWMEYTKFSEWAHSNGYMENLTIERIDVNGNYEPSNCTWIPASEQAKNRTSNKWVTIEGKKYSPTELSETYNISVGTIYARIARGDKGLDVVRPLGGRGKGKKTIPR